MYVLFRCILVACCCDGDAGAWLLWVLTCLVGGHLPGGTGLQARSSHQPSGKFITHYPSPCSHDTVQGLSNLRTTLYLYSLDSTSRSQLHANSRSFTHLQDVQCNKQLCWWACLIGGMQEGKVACWKVACRWSPCHDDHGGHPSNGPLEFPALQTC